MPNSKKNKEISCQTETFLTAMNFISKNGDRIDDVKHSDIVNYTRGIRRAIVFLIKAHKDVEFNFSSNDLIAEILGKLEESHNLKYYGISKKVEAILKNDREQLQLYRITTDLNDKLSDLLYYDTETSLPNKAKCTKDVLRENGCGLISINISNLAVINSAYGRENGDFILFKIAKKILGLEDLLGVKLYRYSPTEYVLLIKEEKLTKNICIRCNIGEGTMNCKTRKKDYSCAIEHLIKKVEAFIGIIDVSIKGCNILVNFNVAGVFGEGDDLLNKLQITSQEAINSNKSLVYSDELGDRIKKEHQSNFEWANKVKNGLQNGDIVPFFQGIVDNNTQEIIKYESLVRLVEGDRVRSPFFFLEPAKKAMLLGEITKVMFIKTLEEMQKSNKDFSINISDTDINDGEFINFIVQELEKSKIEPSRITFEFLETISSSGEDMLESLKFLKSLGIKIAIDDFGTGYSNFQRLLDLEPDFLKIDASLIKECDLDKRKQKIISSITTLAHTIGAKVVAEFVDTKEVSDLMLKLGVDYSQGYLSHKPSPTTDIEK